jgi:hypothetical protein
LDGDSVGVDAECADCDSGGDAGAVAERVLGQAGGKVGAGRGGDGCDEDGGGVEGCGGGIAKGEGDVGDDAFEEVEVQADWPRLAPAAGAYVVTVLTDRRWRSQKDKAKGKVVHSPGM